VTVWSTKAPEHAAEVRDDNKQYIHRQTDRQTDVNVQQLSVVLTTHQLALLLTSSSQQQFNAVTRRHTEINCIMCCVTAALLQ